VTEKSEQSIVIAAEPAAVMAVIADFDRYPQWASSLTRTEVLELGADGRARRVAFRLESSVVNDVYELVYDWRGDHRVMWHQVRGETIKAQDGSYTLVARPDGGTHVTYSLSVELAMPMLGALKRKAERVVMDTALKELKKYVESRPSDDSRGEER